MFERKGNLLDFFGYRTVGIISVGENKEDASKQILSEDGFNFT